MFSLNCAMFDNNIDHIHQMLQDYKATTDTTEVYSFTDFLPEIDNEVRFNTNIYTKIDNPIWFICNHFN